MVADSQQQQQRSSKWSARIWRKKRRGGSNNNEEGVWPEGIPWETRTRIAPKQNLWLFLGICLPTVINLLFLCLMGATLVVAYDRAFGAIVFALLFGGYALAWLVLYAVGGCWLWSKKEKLRPAVLSACTACFLATLTAFVLLSIWMPLSNLNHVRIESFEWVDPLNAGSLDGEERETSRYVFVFGEDATLPPLSEGIYGEKVITETANAPQYIYYCVYPITAATSDPSSSNSSSPSSSPPYSYINSSRALSVNIDAAIACQFRPSSSSSAIASCEHEVYSSSASRCFRNVRKVLDSSSTSTSPLKGMVGLRADMYHRNHLLDKSEFELVVERLREVVNNQVGGRMEEDVTLLTLFQGGEQFEEERDRASRDFAIGVGLLTALLASCFLGAAVGFAWWMRSHHVRVHRRTAQEMKELGRQLKEQTLQRLWQLRASDGESKGGTPSFLSLLPAEVLGLVEQMVIHNTPSD